MGRAAPALAGIRPGKASHHPLSCRPATAPFPPAAAGAAQALYHGHLPLPQHRRALAVCQRGALFAKGAVAADGEVLHKVRTRHAPLRLPYTAQHHGLPRIVAIRAHACKRENTQKREERNRTALV
jgi:hypothetical protein